MARKPLKFTILNILIDAYRHFRQKRQEPTQFGQSAKSATAAAQHGSERDRFPASNTATQHGQDSHDQEMDRDGINTQH